MNPRAWDIYHLKISSDNPKAHLAMAALKKLNDKGFTIRLATQDELEIAEENLQCHERFVNKTLVKADIQHIYYPKPEMFDRVRQALNPFKKEEGKE